MVWNSQSDFDVNWYGGGCLDVLFRRNDVVEALFARQVWAPGVARSLDNSPRSQGNYILSVSDFSSCRCVVARGLFSWKMALRGWLHVIIFHLALKEGLFYASPALNS